MKTGLDPVEMKDDFLFEAILPGGRTRYLSIENDCISLIPNAPSSYHEKLHEKRMRRSSLSKHNLVMNLSFIIPNNTKRKPPISSTWTIKEEMLQCFFHITSAHDTVVAFQVLLSSLQYIPGVQSVV